MPSTRTAQRGPPCASLQEGPKVHLHLSFELKQPRKGLVAAPQMVWPWKLQSSHLLSSSIFQKVLSHSPVSSFFSLIQRATCIIRRGMSQSLQRDSTVSSSSRGREVLLKRGPQVSLSLQTISIYPC